MPLNKLGSGSKTKYPRVKAKSTSQRITQKTQPSKKKFTR